MMRKSSLFLLLTLAAFAVGARAQTIVMTPSTTTLSPSGGTLTFTTTITYTSTPAVLAFSTTLPNGWTYLSTTGGATNLNSPPANTTGTLNWFYTPPAPASPASFSFTTSYPAGISGLQPFTTSAVTRDTVGGAAVTTTGPTVSITAPPTAFTWVGDTSGAGNWTTASNWNPNGVPNNTATSAHAATINSGTPTIPSGTSIALNNLLLLGGTLTNLGSLTLTDVSSSWAGGILAGAGQLVNASGALLTASGTATHDFNQQTISNQGQFVWTGSGNLRSGSGGAFVNGANSVFTDASASGTTAPTRITSAGFTGNFTFNNAGVYQKTGAGETKIEIPFTNSGSILVSAGNLHFDNVFTMSSGVLRVATGATAQLDAGLNLAAGALIGGGTVLANVTSSSLISPGDTLGRLTIQGNLTLLSTSQLLIDISAANATPGLTYDFLNVSGTAQLGGTLSLNVTSTARTTILPTDTFTILSATSISGSFLNAPNGTRLMSNFGQGSFLVSYTGNSIVLSGFNPIPEPSTWALLATGLGALAFRAVRRRR